MNPFTKSLAAQVRSQQLQQLIGHWDALEALVIRVFRGKAATAQDEQDYAAVRLWLVENYSPWAAELVPLWQQALRGGKPSQDDPFQFLFQPEHAQDFVGSWAHMQALPAAREALNRLILNIGAQA